MKVWLVMYWDYEQTGPGGIFDSIEAVFEKYPDVSSRHEHMRREWKQERDGSWSQSNSSGLSAELVEVETVESVRASEPKRKRG